LLIAVVTDSQWSGGVGLCNGTGGGPAGGLAVAVLSSIRSSLCIQLGSYQVGLCWLHVGVVFCIECSLSARVPLVVVLVVLGWSQTLFFLNMKRARHDLEKK
jgi:hypothetical protein